MKIFIYLLLFFFVKHGTTLFVQCVRNGDDSSLKDEDHIDDHEKLKYRAEFNVNPLFTEKPAFSEKFEKFFKLIAKAENEFDDCFTHSKSSCDCFSKQIDSDLKPFDGGIIAEDIEQSKRFGVHYQIIDHRLYREQQCMFPLRCKGVEHFLLKVMDDLSDSEFVVNVHDWPQVPKSRQKPLPILSFSKEPEFYIDILYPAWSFWSGGPAIEGHPMGVGRWDLLKSSIDKSRTKWENKKSVAFFRGSRTSAERDPIILLSRKYPNLIDAKYTKNQAWRSKADTLGDEPAEVVSFESHCPFKYLFNFRGVAASFRHRHLFVCQSLVLNVDSHWIEYYYNELKPWIHFVPIENDLSNVNEVLEFLRFNDKVAEKIAVTGYNFIWRSLTLESVECYWRQLMQRYTKLLRFKPKRLNSLIEIK